MILSVELGGRRHADVAGMLHGTVLYKFAGMLHGTARYK